MAAARALGPARAQGRALEVPELVQARGPALVPAAQELELALALALAPEELVPGPVRARGRGPVLVLEVPAQAQAQERELVQAPEVLELELELARVPALAAQRVVPAQEQVRVQAPEVQRRVVVPVLPEQVPAPVQPQGRAAARAGAQPAPPVLPLVDMDPPTQAERHPPQEGVPRLQVPSAMASGSPNRRSRRPPCAHGTGTSVGRAPTIPCAASGSSGNGTRAPPTA